MPDRLAARARWTFALVVVAGLPVAAAGAQTEDVPILGGTAAFAQTLGITPSPDAPRFIGELTRILYNVSEGKSRETDAAVQRLVSRLDLVRHFQQLVASAEWQGGAFSLAGAAQRDQRERLNSLFAFIGLTLQEKSRQYSVQPSGDKHAMERLKLLAALNVDLEQLQTQLNKGESVTIEIPTELVPVPMTAKFWSDVVFQRAVAPRDLVTAILGNRNAALLCRGLSGLDDPTLDYLQSHPAIVTRIYEHDATIFGAFSDSLRIRNGVVDPPGGPPATALWEALLDEKVTRPDLFIRELFSRAGGRSAYLYSTIDHLDPARRAFALGLWITNPDVRPERFHKFADAAIAALADWQINVRPFDRTMHDVAMLLARVGVDDLGAPGEPRAQLFWSRVFESTDLPDEPARLVRNVHESGDIDAAWLADAMLMGDGALRQHRFEQFTFGQRVFRGIDDSALPNALIGIRAYPRFPMLMLALERLGARDPSTYAAAARQAARLGNLDPDRGFVALSQFQGALAVLVRLARVHALPVDRSESLANALTAIPLHDGWYEGGVAHWLRGPLGAAIGLQSDDFDSQLTAALAGASAASSGRGVRVSWEGHAYRIDLAAPERRRLDRIREKSHRMPLDVVLALGTIADELSQPSIDVNGIGTALSRLRALPKLATNQAADRTPPPKVDPSRPPADIVTKAVQDLSKIIQPKDLKQAQVVSQSLSRLVDRLLADSLRSLAYALELGDAEESVISGLDVSARHDFGFGSPAQDARALAPWAEAQQHVQAGIPWHMQGSLLNLDLSLSRFALRRVSAPRLGQQVLQLEAKTFALSATAMDASELRDEDRDRIAEAIQKGRERVIALSSGSVGDNVDVLREETLTDGWRRRAVQWAAEHHADPTIYLSLAEFLQLGRGGGGASLNAWGPAAWPGDTCLCTRLNLWNSWMPLAGRPRVGLLATQMPDLNLRVAVALYDLRLPAVLARDILLAATLDYIETVAPTDNGDWLTLVRSGQAVTRQRIDDYIAALAATGPLVPDDAPQRPTQ